MGDLPFIFNVAIRRPVEVVFVVFDTVVEPTDLFFETMDFTGFLGVTSGNGCKEPFGDGSEDVHIELGVGRQGGCNCTRQHRWFWTLDPSDWERGAVLGG